MKVFVSNKEELMNLIKVKFNDYFYGEIIGNYINLNGDEVFKLVIQ